MLMTACRRKGTTVSDFPTPWASIGQAFNRRKGNE
jgi:hypothetical protein